MCVWMFVIFINFFLKICFCYIIKITLRLKREMHSMESKKCITFHVVLPLTLLRIMPAARFEFRICKRRA